MQTCKIFGNHKNLPLLPKSLLGAFSVVGVEKDSQYAISYTLSKLQQHRRIQKLILVLPTHLQESQLAKIRDSHCEIYFFLRKDFKFLDYYKTLSRFGLVIAF